MSPSEPTEAEAAQFVAAMSQPAPRLYANGFHLAQTLSDVAVVLQANGATVGLLNMSFTSAKTLALQLQDLVAQFETRTGQKLLTMNEIAEKTGTKNA